MAHSDVAGRSVRRTIIFDLGPTRIISVNSSNIETYPGGDLTPKNQQVEHFARQSNYNKGLEMIAEDKNPAYSYRFAKATGKGEGLDSIAN